MDKLNMDIINKKLYQAPTIKRVQLKVNVAVLAACRTSTSPDYLGADEPCYDPNLGCKSRA